jgi:preprotein translocase SecE subunit
MASLRSFIEFLKDAYNELQHVSWLTRKEMMASTAVVVIVVIIATILVFIFDATLTRLLTAILTL